MRFSTVAGLPKYSRVSRHLRPTSPVVGRSTISIFRTPERMSAACSISVITDQTAERDPLMSICDSTSMMSLAADHAGVTSDDLPCAARPHPDVCVTSVVGRAGAVHLIFHHDGLLAHGDGGVADDLDRLDHAFEFVIFDQAGLGRVDDAGTSLGKA